MSNNPDLARYTWIGIMQLYNATSLYSWARDTAYKQAIAAIDRLDRLLANELLTDRLTTLSGELDEFIKPDDIYHSNKLSDSIRLRRVKKRNFFDATWEVFEFAQKYPIALLVNPIIGYGHGLREGLRQQANDLVSFLVYNTQGFPDQKIHVAYIREEAGVSLEEFMREFIQPAQNSNILSDHKHIQFHAYPADTLSDLCKHLEIASQQ